MTNYKENPPAINLGFSNNKNATKVRLLKVKEMVLQEAHNYK